MTVLGLDDLVFVGVPIRGPIVGEGPATLVPRGRGGGVVIMLIEMLIVLWLRPLMGKTALSRTHLRAWAGGVFTGALVSR